MVKSLQEICLTKICSDLYYYYQFCKRRSIRIPQCLGDKIFDIFYKNLFPKKKENSLLIFHREITSLTEFRIDTKLFKNFEILKYLDKDSLKKITFLFDSLTNNQLLKLEEGLKNFKNLKYFTAPVSVGDEKLNKILNGISQSCHSLTHLDFSFCSITQSNSKDFGNFLWKCTNIEYIDFTGCQDIEDGISNIINGLENSRKSLRGIYLGFCSFNESHIKLISNFIESINHLEDIHLTGINGYSLSLLSNSLVNSSKCLKKLYFGSSSLNIEQSNDVKNLLLQCSSIEKVDFSCCKFVKNGIRNICNGLISSSNKLRKINFKFCHLTREDCESLKILLLHCIKLEKIDLRYNSNMINGFTLICEGLKSLSNSLNDVLLSGCKLTRSQVHSFCNLLESCGYLETFHFNCFRISGKKNILHIANNLFFISE